MRADNTTTGSNRIIRLTNLLMVDAGDLPELTIQIIYKGDSNASNAICLDKVVIPAIVAAINREHDEMTESAKGRRRVKHRLNDV